MVGLELPDVGDDLFRQVFLVLPCLHVRAVKPLHVLAVEDGRPRLDGFELGTNLLEQRRVEDTSGLRGFVAVVVEQVPAAEDDVVQAGDGQDVGDAGRASLGALAEANGAHLRERADRLRETLADGENAGDDGGADGAKADEEDAKLALRGLNLNWFHSDLKIYHPKKSFTSRSRRTGVYWR